MKPASVEFKRILDKIEKEGIISNPRGYKVKEILLQTLEINPLYPIVDFPDRRFNWKYLTGEICWYLTKERSIDYISNFSNFWNNIKNEDGTANSNYGCLLLGKQLRWVYDSLIKDKNSRQAIAFLNQPKFQYEGVKDFVCSMYLNFFIRNNKLNMKLCMRSNDMFYGFSYDAPWFSFIMQFMYLWLKKTYYPDLELGTYYHYVDNIHYYEKHFVVAKNILDKDIIAPPIFELKDTALNLFKIDESGEYILLPEGKYLIEQAAHYSFDKNKTYDDYKKLFKPYII